MLRMSALKTFAIVLAMISVRAGGDDDEIPTLPSLNINLASVCNQEKVADFQNLLYNYMYSDLTQNSSLDPIEYSTHISSQQKTLKSSLDLFKTNFDQVKTEITPFLINWFTFFSAFHYEAYATENSRTKFQNKMKVLREQFDFFKELSFDISIQSITNLISLYINNLEYQSILEETAKTKEETDLHKGITTILQNMKLDFYDIIDGIFKACINRNSKSVISQTWFTFAYNFVGYYTIFRSFLGFDKETEVFDLDDEGDQADGLLSSTAFYGLSATSKGPLRQQVLVHMYLITQAYVEPVSDDIDYLYMLRKSSKSVTSRAFLQWLNHKDEENQTNIFLAKKYLFFIYLYISSNAHNSIKLDVKDVKLLTVAKALKSFLLDTSFCFKESDPSGPYKVSEILIEGNTRIADQDKIFQKYKSKCYFEDFLDRDLYIKDWLLMLELVYKIIAQEQKSDLATLLATDSEAIKKIWFLEKVKISGGQNQNNVFYKTMVTFLTQQTRKEFIDTMYVAIDETIEKKYSSYKVSTSTMDGNMIADVWKAVNAAIQSYTEKKNAETQSENTFYDLIFAETKPTFIDDLEYQMNLKDQTHARKYFLYRFISNIAVQQVQVLNEMNENGTNKDDANYKKRNTFLKSISGVIFRYIEQILSQSVDQESKEGIKRYFITSLNRQTSVSHIYYSSNQANNLRFYDFYFFVFQSMEIQTQEANIKLIESKKAFMYEFKSKEEYSNKITDDSQFLMTLDGFESFKNFIPIFKYFNRERIAKDEATSSYSDSFLHFFNMMYNFLAVVRVGRKDLLINPNRIVFEHSIICLRIKRGENIPNFKEFKDLEKQMCPLDYGEQLEVTYGLITFIGKTHPDFLSDYVFLKTDPEDQKLKLLRDFKPARLDQFLKMVYYNSDVASFWNSECNIQSDSKKTEKKTDKATKGSVKSQSELYELKPICLAVDIIRESMNCGGVQVKNTVGENLIDDTTAIVSASVWIGSCLNEPFKFLGSITDTAKKTEETKEEKEAREAKEAKVINYKLYFLAAFSALFELDATNGLFESLLEQAKINGVQSFTVKLETDEQEVVKTMYKNYKIFENKIAFIQESAKANITPEETEERKKKLDAEIKELSNYIKLRYSRVNPSSEDMIFSKSLFEFINGNINNLVAFGDINFNFAEAMVLYAQKDSEYDLAAEVLLTTGRTLGLAKIKPNVECSFRIIFKSIVESYTLKGKDEFKKDLLKDMELKGGALTEEQKTISSELDKTLSDEEKRLVGFVRLSFYYVVSSAVITKTAVELESSNIEESVGYSKFEQEIVKEANLSTEEEDSSGLAHLGNSNVVLEQLNKHYSEKNEEKLEQVTTSKEKPISSAKVNYLTEKAIKEIDDYIAIESNRLGFSEDYIRKLLIGFYTYPYSESFLLNKRIEELKKIYKPAQKLKDALTSKNIYQLTVDTFFSTSIIYLKQKIEIEKLLKTAELDQKAKAKLDANSDITTLNSEISTLTDSNNSETYIRDLDSKRYRSFVYNQKKLINLLGNEPINRSAKTTQEENDRVFYTIEMEFRISKENIREINKQVENIINRFNMKKHERDFNKVTYRYNTAQYISQFSMENKTINEKMRFASAMSTETSKKVISSMTKKEASFGKKIKSVSEVAKRNYVANIAPL